MGLNWTIRAGSVNADILAHVSQLVFIRNKNYRKSPSTTIQKENIGSFTNQPFSEESCIEKLLYCKHNAGNVKVL